ncbi:alanine--tRNA ligase [Candidatus Falkowbacteria bacterium]|jgi:alanyl-tRNA synthetase|nr:alanine--tRNA ligase [Candidatus Falkowbacteria bacterium]MBT7007369.1 alanine--tRNA ligase [Candidatus Falkowbacteria bacterium]
MTTNELRQKYLNFFKSKGHAIIPSASLIPENDPSVLFSTAGMHPLVPYLMGEKHPAGTTLASVQKCVRTGDIDEVGDNTHGTFFEMLGNWSLGDYFKKESIEMSFEFLTKELNIPIEKLAFTVFEGDDDADKDVESAEFWKSHGVLSDRIQALNKEENWWPAGGKNPGPQGPDTEIFYWASDEPAPEKFDPEDDTWIEIWNNVFMQFNKTDKGYEPLKQKNVDTGMGLERTVAVLNGIDDLYQIDIYVPIIKKIEEITGLKYSDKKREFRIVADHIRSAVMIMGDRNGIAPSNLDQGYIVRRLIRRAVRFGKILGIDKAFTHEVAEVVLVQMSAVYDDVKENHDNVLNQLKAEEEKFAKTLEKGLKEFEKMSSDNKISGAEAFILFSTYGFPLEMTQELAAEKGVTIDEVEFEKEMKKHQEASKKGSEQKFKGGLADSGEETARLHTATHLLQAALRKVLGDHVAQKGSNITTERLRFDFTHDEKLTDEQKQEVEKLVNEWIKADYEVNCEELSFDEAKNKGAIGLFEDKYGDQVKVYSIDEISCEMCGGPHAKRTGELGHFKIKKEKASSAGVRRIKAVLE